jgi:sortase A
MQPSFVTPALPAQPRGFAALLGDALRRPGGRRVLSALSVVLFLSGVAMFAYPVGTDLYGRWQQDRLRHQLGSAQLVQGYENHHFAVGSVLTRLRIPKKGINLDILVVEGVTPAALRAGAGHYPLTPLPGEIGNVAIAGHRTTFLRPFNHLDEMAPGDQVILETPFKIFHYVVIAPFDGHANPWVVSKDDTRALNDTPGHYMLTLTTCHPKGSARQRLILRLELNPALTEDVKQKGA